jgi:signal transduction histidine kinase
MTLLGNLLVLLLKPFGDLIGSPWIELISYLALGAYVVAAWRLAPGAGAWPRRLLRVATWTLIFGLLNGLIGWVVLTYLPLPGNNRFLGMRLDEMRISFGAYLLSAVFLAGSLFLPARLLLAIWGLGRRRLRWRLTFSYLLVGVLTLFLAPLALLIFVSAASLATVPALFATGDVAPQLAAALAPSLRAGAPPDQLQTVLAGLLDGTTRLPVSAGAATVDAKVAEAGQLTDLASGGVRRLTLVRPDGRVLASAGRAAFAAGAPLNGPEAEQIRLLLDGARARAACVEGRPASGLLVDSAVCPIADAAGAPLALLAVESNLDSSAQVGAAFGRIITLTLIGFSLTINLTILIVIAILPVGLGVGYLLARGLTRRIEQLAAATADISAGSLDRQVPIDSQDEIGLLGAGFNAMALRLAEREQALADSAARAEELLRVNRRLVADVSHELRNPLATLRGYLEALAQDYGERLPARDMQVIQAEVQRLTGLVDDLFTLARAEARQLPLSPAPLDVGAMLVGLAEALAPLARREREIELVAQVPPGLPAVLADPTRLEQVLRNLIQNALRHTPPGGIIALSAEPAGPAMLALSVADTGVGIASEDLPHVFERFYRGDSSRARETGGAGLGLSLVRELVAAMGGAVRAESTPGRGSRFVVALPTIE